MSSETREDDSINSESGSSRDAPQQKLDEAQSDNLKNTKVQPRTLVEAPSYPYGHEFDYDVIVIGAGPAGEAAAMKLSKSGAKVLVISEKSEVGGNCAHWGTIPSKALRQTVFNLISFRRDPLFSNAKDWYQVPLTEVLKRAHDVIELQVATHQRFYERNRINIIHGKAQFVEDHKINIELLDGGIERVNYHKAVIATGSRPYRPKELDFTHPRVLDSDKVLGHDKVVKKIIIYGAGVIGCEYASIFVGLGCKVELINNQKRLLSFLDEEISDALSHDLRQLGVLIRSEEEMDSLDTYDDHVVLNLKSGKRIMADAILWSNGRSGNTEGLGLKNVGIDVNSRGQLSVNNHYQTANEFIYAAGDVMGWPSLASAAYDQGRAAAGHLLGEDAICITEVPTGIYTIPEISCIGKTEQELTEDKVPYEVGQAFFKHLARAQIIGERSGLLKILFHRETLEVLGVHCFGNHASEIIHIGQAVMNSPNNSLNYFVETTFNYPTMAEAYRVAALNGMNRLF